MRAVNEFRDGFELAEYSHHDLIHRLHFHKARISAEQLLQKLLRRLDKRVRIGGKEDAKFVAALLA